MICVSLSVSLSLARSLFLSLSLFVRAVVYPWVLWLYISILFLTTMLFCVLLWTNNELRRAIRMEIAWFRYLSCPPGVFSMLQTPASHTKPYILLTLCIVSAKYHITSSFYIVGLISDFITTAIHTLPGIRKS